jgi:hypothetical protein
MTKFILLAAVATLSLSAVSAEARDRWRQRPFDPWADRPEYVYQDDEEDVTYYEPDTFADDDDVVIPLRHRSRAQQMRDAEIQIDDRLWWLEDNARSKLEQRRKARKTVAKKDVARVESVVEPKAPKADQFKTASLGKPNMPAKPKAKTAATSKTIGCTAGAAVVTGYGFGAVKPKTCTGNTYAYTAARAGKIYEIKLTAASGEITDVRKLN